MSPLSSRGWPHLGEAVGRYQDNLEVALLGWLAFALAVTVLVALIRHRVEERKRKAVRDAVLAELDTVELPPVICRVPAQRQPESVDV